VNEILVQMTPYVGIVLAAVASLAMMLVIGVGFLLSPGRATLDWSFAFALLTIASYGGVAALLLDSDPLRRVSLAAVMAVPALMWSGVRAMRGVADLVWVGAAFALFSAGVLLVSAGTSWDAVAYRGMFLVAAAFAVLLIVEWWRMPRPRPRALLLLVAASAVLAVAVIGAAAIGPVLTSAVVNDEIIGLVVSAAGVAYVVGAVVAAIAPPIRSLLAARGSAASLEWEAFERSAALACRQAQATSEACSMVHIQLDDAAEIQDTSGRATLAQLSREVEAAIRSVVPPDALIGQPRVGRFVVLIRRPDAEIRDLVREVLRGITRIELEGRDLQPSASAGWAQSSTVGYEPGALGYMAAEAAAIASEKGGDRWERVGPTVINRLLSEPALR